MTNPDKPGAVAPVDRLWFSVVSLIQEQAAIWCDGGRLLQALQDTANQDPTTTPIGGGLDRLEDVIATTDTSTIPSDPEVPGADGIVPVENLVAEALVWLFLTRAGSCSDAYLRLAQRLIDRRLCNPATFHHLLVLGLLVEGTRTGQLTARLYRLAEGYVHDMRPDWAGYLADIHLDSGDTG